jgi:hypothetical protein
MAKVRAGLQGYRVEDGPFAKTLHSHWPDLKCGVLPETFISGHVLTVKKPFQVSRTDAEQKKEYERGHQISIEHLQ